MTRKAKLLRMKLGPPPAAARAAALGRRRCTCPARAACSASVAALDAAAPPECPPFAQQRVLLRRRGPGKGEDSTPAQPGGSSALGAAACGSCLRRAAGGWNGLRARASCRGQKLVKKA